MIINHLLSITFCAKRSLLEAAQHYADKVLGLTANTCLCQNLGDSAQVDIISRPNSLPDRGLQLAHCAVVAGDADLHHIRIRHCLCLSTP